MSEEQKLPLGRIYQNFAGQLCSCYSTGAFPNDASQDTRHYLMLQMKRLAALGITAEKKLADRTACS
ncbi:hypothetical protein SAMN02910447_01350 [Ruminococcus sp. YE71]|uniref:hypothetical protein n=1 Tax=unclassified Ruminococcus TaxID=2608920 RepID=UPI000887C74D|nr:MULTISPECIES: hypothetical protein [unclassified Ruminococcus]SDA17646.1 hypothetical protein SAMN02910446_01349 [Ruminococcus sp. YE78]SFW27148.1 hypothetical protein SAMN02910447_01350 [Ruminococcus sp. YE71]